MKAILIDVYDRTVGEVEFDGTLKGMYGLLRCGIVQPIRLGASATADFLWIDEEGALKTGVPTFMLEGFRQPLAGNGLVCGNSEEGELADVTLDVEQVFDMITFSDLVTTGVFTPGSMKPAGGTPFDFVIDMGTPIFTTKGSEE